MIILNCYLHHWRWRAVYYTMLYKTFIRGVFMIVMLIVHNLHLFGAVFYSELYSELTSLKRLYWMPLDSIWSLGLPGVGWPPQIYWKLMGFFFSGIFCLYPGDRILRVVLGQTCIHVTCPVIFPLTQWQKLELLFSHCHSIIALYIYVDKTGDDWKLHDLPWTININHKHG